MERSIGSTELRQRLTDVLQAVREQGDTYIVETFERSQAALISLEEYRLYQRFLQEREAFLEWLGRGEANHADQDQGVRNDELLALAGQLREHLSSQDQAAGRLEELAEVVTRLEELAYGRRGARPATAAFGRILERAADLGVEDLAEQHDHYLYGVEKR